LCYVSLTLINIYLRFAFIHALWPLVHVDVTVAVVAAAGKSNLMDAISFVLGVQSRHLRSQKLDDLIFRCVTNTL
jgi:hypothetical protein